MKYVIFIFFAASIIGAITFWNDYVLHRTETSVVQDDQDAPSDPFLALEIAARAAYVFDVQKGIVLYEKNGELQFPLASIAKVMSALVAREIAPDAIVTITGENLAAEGDSGLLKEERWRISDLIDFTLMTSSNDGARALASIGAIGTGGGAKPEHLFVDYMNEKARALGMAQTFFLNETGLDEEVGISGAYGSAKDVATLFEYIIHVEPNLFSATTMESARISSFDASHAATNTNVIAARIPGLIASKTGFTDLAGGNLAIAFEAGPLHPVIVIVLGSTEEGRFADVETLVHAAVTAINMEK